MRGVEVQPTSHTTESASAGCVPTRPPSPAAHVGELPVEPGVEPRGETRGDVAAEDRLGEEDVVEAALLDDLRDHVHARLRQRRVEARVVGHVDRLRPVRARPGREALDAAADDHAGDVAAQRGRLRQHAERRLEQLALVVLEEDERLHRAAFPAL